MQGNNNTMPSYFDGAPVTKIQRRMFFLIILGYFFDQMDNINMAFIAPALIKSWGVSMTDIGKINSLYFVGMLIGGLMGGWLSDFLGRKKSFLLSIFTFSVFSIANGLAPNMPVFMIARFLTGAGIACMLVISLTYISEMTPGESRGKWQGLIAAIAIFAVPLMGIISRMVIPLSPEAWRVIFYIGGAGIVAVFLGVPWLKESPRWLVSKGRVGEAEKIVEEIVPGRKLDLSVHARKAAPKKNMAAEILEMFRGTLLKRTIVLTTVSILGTAASFAFINWAPTLLRQKGFSLEDSLLAGFLFTLGMPVGGFLAALISDKGGRKVPWVAMMASLSLVLIIYGLLSAKIAIIVAGILFQVCNTCSTCLYFSYIPENYPTRIRNTASGFIWSIGRISTAFVQLIIPVLYAGLGYGGYFAVTGGAYLICAIVVGAWGIRTAGRSLEEINEEPGESAVAV